MIDVFQKSITDVLQKVDLIEKYITDEKPLTPEISLLMIKKLLKEYRYFTSYPEYLPNKPAGLEHIDTLADCFRRSDLLASPDGGQHRVYANKDQRRIVFLAKEVRNLQIGQERLINLVHRLWKADTSKIPEMGKL